MIQERIVQSLKDAMKAGDGFRTGTLRMLLAAFHNREIEKRAAGEAGVTDADVIAVLEREAKKRKEAAELFTKGGRADLAEKEARELRLIEEYLPPRISEEEIKKVVGELHAGGLADFPSLMKEAMKRLKGKADGGAVAAAVKRALE